ncbi:MAG: hypothetical protein Q8O55_05045 [Dehalococcoidales bacterium]|nr:hypothetical protein [Dehalococcoidales bacterium]MDZ4230468.1 hypothetical protein [Dehalococcoidales bacterium]
MPMFLNKANSTDYQPQQVGVVVEMAMAIQDGQVTPLETQKIVDVGLAFGLSLVFGTVLGVLVRSVVAEALEPEQGEAVQPVIDFMLPRTEMDILDRLIREKKNDLNWDKWPDGTVSDARKAVYGDILEGFRTVAEAKEYVEGQPDDNVIYTARGDEIPFALIRAIVADIEKNPWLSPFRTGCPQRSWQPPLLPLIIKCAWCGRYLGEKEPYEDKSVTHGICPECRAKYFPKKDDLLPQTRRSIPSDDLKRIAGEYGWWAARQAEALCPHGDIACVEREARRLYEVVKRRRSA